MPPEFARGPPPGRCSGCVTPVFFLVARNWPDPTLPIIFVIRHSRLRAVQASFPARIRRIGEPAMVPQPLPSPHSTRVFSLLGGPWLLDSPKSVRGPRRWAHPNPASISSGTGSGHSALGFTILGMRTRNGTQCKQPPTKSEHHVAFHLMLRLRSPGPDPGNAVRLAAPPFLPCPSELGCFSAPGLPSPEFSRCQKFHSPRTSFAGHDGRIPPEILHVQGSFASLPGVSILPHDSFSTMNTAVLITA